VVLPFHHSMALKAPLLRNEVEADLEASAIKLNEAYQTRELDLQQLPEQPLRHFWHRLRSSCSQAFEVSTNHKEL